MADDLLLQYGRTRSEEAFRTLVKRHSGLVYRTALRLLGGDRAAAEDVSQEVFTLLARKAAALGDSAVVLENWLHRQACRRAINHLRSEGRRRGRERIAAEQLAAGWEASPALTRELDRALLALPEGDRTGLILRFFEDRDYRSIGQTMGIAEEAARKRVTRALDKLGGVLKRQGVLVSGATLGGGLTALGREPVPAGWSDAITSSGPARSGGSLLAPVLAGVALTSLVAASARLVERPFTTPVPPPGLTAGGAGKIPERRMGAVAAAPDLIAEIRRIRSGPANELTALRLDALLESIPNAGIPDFIRLGNEKLTEPERGALYERLLKRWLAEDPVAALDFTLAENVGAQVDAVNGTSLLNNLFDSFMEADRAAAGDWLLAHWQNETLGQLAFLSSLRDHLANSCASDELQLAGVDHALAWIARVPDEATRRSLLRSLTSDDPYSRSWLNLSAERRLELARGIGDLPDAAFGRELKQNLWKSWGQDFPDQLEAIAGQLTPSERYAVALGQFGMVSRRGLQIPTPGGGITTHPEPISDYPAREAAVLAAGEAAGISRAEILQEMGETVVRLRPGEAALAWLDEHRGEVAVDDLLIEKAAKEAKRFGISVVDPPEAPGMQWAARIADPDLRASLCRGSFLRLLGSDPAGARKYLQSGGPPADLMADFTSLLPSTP